ncbi:MAG: diaminopimelate decarboxylase [Gemmatimonadetes bacterium]|nr:diaminopimelate decarboxylase [Gemmatimonadota bacterium]
MRTPLLAVEGVLHLDGVSLEALATAADTPAYVYSGSTISARYRELTEALAPVPHRVHYACKANASLGILGWLRELGAGVDVVSGGELYRAQQAGFAPGAIIFGGVGKSPQELQAAVAAQVHLITVESEAELREISAIASTQGVQARIGVRVNPEVAVDSVHAYIKTGQKGDKFGVPWDEAERVARLAHALPAVSLVAVGMHIGSQLTNLAPLADGLQRLETLVGRLRSTGVSTLESLDIGGGLYVPYDHEPAADLVQYAAIVVPALQRIALTLIVEPGRFLVAEAGALLTRVLYRKRTGGRDVLVTDAGMSDLLRPSHYDAYHRILAVRPREARTTLDVVGPICESGDFLALDRPMEDVGAGELLVLCTTGAYGSCMASNYNSRTRATELLVHQGQWAVITERESYADLVRRETVTPQWRTQA